MVRKNHFLLFVLLYCFIFIFFLNNYIIPDQKKIIYENINNNNLRRVKPLKKEIISTDPVSNHTDVKITTDPVPPFSVVIVTHNEKLLLNTVTGVLRTADDKLLEIVIIDDCSTPPVVLPIKDDRIRIIRSKKRLGLIRARILGGDSSRGEMIAFIDGHVLVAPNWLQEPMQILRSTPNALVNYINFDLDKTQFRPKESATGIGSSATISISLEQYWGGGSTTDDYSPITYGMFATTKQWWQQGRMDPGLLIWGGENVEISLRTWLCGGVIRVAKTSYVAHAFRAKFPYAMNNRILMRNYIRVAKVWMNKKYLALFYKANGLNGKTCAKEYHIGSIQQRLKLKRDLKCLPFSSFAQRFKGRALCMPSRRGSSHCGTVHTFSLANVNSTYVSHLFGY